MKLSSTTQISLRAILRKMGSLALAGALLTAQMPAALAGADSTDAAEFVTLKDVKVKGNQIVLKTSKPAPYNVFKVSAPNRLVIDLTYTENAFKKKEFQPEDSDWFGKVRIAQFQNDPVKVARIVVELKAPADFETVVEDNVLTLTARKAAAGSPPREAPDQTASMAAAPTPAEKVGETVPSPQAPVPVSPPPSETTTSKLKAEKAKDSLATEPSSLFGRQLVTLDFNDIEIKELFRIMSEKAGVNVVYGDEVKGTITIQLRDVSFKDAVDTVLTLKDLRMVALGKNIVQLMTPAEFDKYRTSAISVTKIFPINYAKATDVNIQLTTILSTLGGKGKTLVDDRTNSIIVTDTPDGIDTVTQLILELDKPAPQVMIEAKIVQVSLGKSLDLGISWGIAYTDQSGNQMVTIGASKDLSSTAPETTGGSTGLGLQTRTALNPAGSSGLEAGGAGFTSGTGLGLTFGFVKDVVRLNAALSALQQKNKSRLLSNPKIATLNNQAATIKSEVSEPYITTQTQLTNAGTLSTQVVNESKSGISLSVTPTINADGRITIKIVPDITSSQPTSIGVPKTTSQQANTTVIVRDGETFVIGGLISELESDQKSFIPILGSIPLLGNLFKKTSNSKTRAELLIFVTPKIILY